MQALLRGERGSDVLRISPSWTRWGYWLLLVTAAAGLTGSALGRVDESISGAAIVEAQAEVLALFPLGSAVRAGLPLRLEANGATVSTTIFRVDSDGRSHGPPVLAAHARLPPDAPHFAPGTLGRAEVKLRSQPLLTLLAPAFGRLLGSHGD